MLGKDPNFTRLNAGGLSASGRVTYWLGADQLRIVEVRGVLESYRRFSLRDIRAVTIRGTRMYGGYIALFGVPALLALLVLFSAVPSFSPQSPGDWATLVIFGTIAAVMLFLLLRNAVLGPTCYCELVTGVQSVLLPGVSRRRRAERLIAALRAAVEQDAATRAAREPSTATSPAPSAAVSTPDEAVGRPGPAEAAGPEPGAANPP